MTPSPVEFLLRAVGSVRCRRDAIGYDHWGAVTSDIVLDSTQFEEDALLGIEAYSHLEVVFVFDRIAESEVVRSTLHPRNRVDLPKLGIFATRMVNRPNRLALSRCELIDRKGMTLTVRGLDALDQTPVLDVKPYVREFSARGSVRQPSWLTSLLGEYFAP